MLHSGSTGHRLRCKMYNTRTTHWLRDLVASHLPVILHRIGQCNSTDARRHDWCITVSMLSLGLTPLAPHHHDYDYAGVHSVYVCCIRAMPLLLLLLLVRRCTSCAVCIICMRRIRLPPNIEVNHRTRTIAN